MTIYQPCSVNKEVFRAYDIRGIIDQTFDENAFYSIGKAIAYKLSLLNRSQCLVGRDGRLTSERLAKAMIAGLMDNGITVTDLGLVATPMMYFATKTDTAIDSGVMITGSHNAATYNGVKMVLADRTLANEDILDLYHYVEANRDIARQASYQSKDITPQYLQRISSDIQLKRPLKVVVDAGNGAAGPFIIPLLTQLGCEVIPLYCDIDGHFPNHHPDPTVERNLHDLKQAVAEHQADIGLGFDGDADRLGVITNKGENICPDRLLMRYAQSVIETQPGATIVYDVKCSRHLENFIKHLGGKPHMCPTGHSIVKRVLKEHQAALAGEMSGHIFFQDRWYGFDDAMYSACRLLEMLSQSPLSISEQFKLIPDSVNTPELKIPIDEEKKFDFMNQFCQNAQFDNAKLITIDGLRVEFSDGWGLLRASNTTPYIVARFEADHAEALTAIQQRFRTELLKIDSTLTPPF